LKAEKNRLLFGADPAVLYVLHNCKSATGTTQECAVFVSDVAHDRPEAPVLLPAEVAAEGHAGVGPDAGREDQLCAAAGLPLFAIHNVSSKCLHI
jgi:hypothetical protein